MNNKRQFTLTCDQKLLDTLYRLQLQFQKENRADTIRFAIALLASVGNVMLENSEAKLFLVNKGQEPPEALAELLMFSDKNSKS